MARYKIDSETVVDTAKARQSWREATRHDRQNHIWASGHREQAGEQAKILKCSITLKY